METMASPSFFLRLMETTRQKVAHFFTPHPDMWHYTGTRDEGRNVSPRSLLSHRARSSFMGSRLASWRNGSHWLYSCGLASPGPECLYLLLTQFIPKPVTCPGLSGSAAFASSSVSMTPPGLLSSDQREKELVSR